MWNVSEHGTHHNARLAVVCRNCAIRICTTNLNSTRLPHGLPCKLKWIELSWVVTCVELEDPNLVAANMQRNHLHRFRHCIGIAGVQQQQEQPRLIMECHVWKTHTVQQLRAENWKYSNLLEREQNIRKFTVFEFQTAAGRRRWLIFKICKPEIVPSRQTQLQVRSVSHTMAWSAQLAMVTRVTVLSPNQPTLSDQLLNTAHISAARLVHRNITAMHTNKQEITQRLVTLNCYGYQPQSSDKPFSTTHISPRTEHHRPAYKRTAKPTDVLPHWTVERKDT